MSNKEHEIRWQDDDMVGFTCPEDRNKDLTIDSEQEPIKCEVCGKKLTLIWSVYIREEESE